MHYIKLAFVSMLMALSTQSFSINLDHLRSIDGNEQRQNVNREIIKLVENFMKNTEESLAYELMQLRSGAMRINESCCVEACASEAIAQCVAWSECLEKRGLVEYVKRIELLQATLTQLISCAPPFLKSFEVEKILQEK